MEKVLTIVIPTYNRMRFLEPLLDLLDGETTDQAKVNVVVCDNASTDGTAVVLDRFEAKRPDWLIVRNAENCGAESNFVNGVQKVVTPYFWIIGDDDMPRRGVISHVIQILKGSDPDLLYLTSEWLDDISVNRSAPPFNAGVKVDREKFAQYVNVWVTFISGMIVKIDSLNVSNPEFDPNRFNGTSLVQLGWVLPALMGGKTFIIVDQNWVLATKENSSGYKLITVLGSNLTRIVEEVCGRGTTVTNKILKGVHWNYLPGLIWNIRRQRNGNFVQENVLEALDGLKGYPSYRWVLRPIHQLPIYLAGALYIFLAIFRRFDRLLNSKL